MAAIAGVSVCVCGGVKSMVIGRSGCFDFLSRVKSCGSDGLGPTQRQQRCAWADVGRP